MSTVEADIRLLFRNSGYPNCEVLADNDIDHVLYNKSSERNHLLCWVTYHLGGDKDLLTQYNSDNIILKAADYWEFLGLLKKENKNDFFLGKLSQAEEFTIWMNAFNEVNKMKFFEQKEVKKEDSSHFMKLLNLLEQVYHSQNNTRKEINSFPSDFGETMMSVEKRLNTLMKRMEELSELNKTLRRLNNNQSSS